MPRHPPIALKTLDRSHCQYPSRDPEGIVVQAKPLARLAKRNPEGIVASNQILCGTCLNGIGTKRPASRDPFEGAVRQTHHRQGIERPLRQIMALSEPMKFEQIFSLRCQTEQAQSTRLDANSFYE
ncbi:hypothetical protein MPLA_2090004 [Mesorhizobium sp. ORS 3359]|nr:hypothetical protein MPLA_2090004 [Mesorhizobium sp. ORS 3359]